MKKGILIGVLILVFGLIFGGIVWGTYSELVNKQTDAQVTRWANVQASYQRRLDTIPKFAKNAQFSSEFQIKLATDYAKAREGFQQAATSGEPEKLLAVANSGLSGLIVAVRAEAAVEAKTDQLTELNAEIENVERVINHERAAYNTAVGVYIKAIKQPLAATFISWFGWDFPPIKAFEAQAGAEKSPDYDLKFK